MNQHITKAFHDYSSHNINFEYLLDWHLCNGFVLCQPDCFGIGYFSDSSCPTESAEQHNSNTLFVTYCVGKMNIVLKHFYGQFDYVAFSRDFKNSPSVRLWDYQKTFNRINYGITI
jgi:hypothetical protein